MSWLTKESVAMVINRCWDDYTIIGDKRFVDVASFKVKLLDDISRINRMPTVVCICGFTKEFYEVAMEETLKGKIVLTINSDMQTGKKFMELDDAARANLKIALDRLRLRKIDLADEVLVLNVNGHISESTSREIAYAKHKKKPIIYHYPRYPFKFVARLRDEDWITMDLITDDDNFYAVVEGKHFTDLAAAKQRFDYLCIQRAKADKPEEDYAGSI